MCSKCGSCLHYGSSAVLYERKRDNISINACLAYMVRNTHGFTTKGKKMKKYGTLGQLVPKFPKHECHDRSKTGGVFMENLINILHYDETSRIMTKLMR